jgi:hypothetical protein
MTNENHVDDATKMNLKKANEVFFNDVDDMGYKERIMKAICPPEKMTHDDVAFIRARHNLEELKGHWEEAFIHLSNLYMIAREFPPAPGNCLFPVYNEAENFVRDMDMLSGFQMESREVVP